MEYSAFDLARYILKKCIDDENVICNFQLQRILYYIQECFLREKGHEAFPESIEAWQYGPVVPEVYDHYCLYGGQTIVWMPEDERNIILEDEKDKALIDEIVEKGRNIDPWDTIYLTKKELGAWVEVYDNGKGKGKEITVEMIKEYLRKQKKPTEQKPTVNKNCVHFVLQKIKELFSV